MLGLPGQQCLAHARRPEHLQVIAHTEHGLFLVRLAGEDQLAEMLQAIAGPFAEDAGFLIKAG